MSAIGNNINQTDIKSYLNNVKVSQGIPKEALDVLKSKIATDISNDGKIDAKELEGEKTAFLKAGGTEDQFTSFMKDALGVNTAKFEPKAFSFNPTKSTLRQEQTAQPNQPAPAPTTTPVRKPVAAPKPVTNTSKPFHYENPDAKETNKTIATTAKKAINDSGLTVVATNKYNVSSVTSTKHLAEIKETQKSLGVKVDGYIGPQTFHKLAVKYDEAVASGNTAEANKIKSFVEKLNLTAAFPNIKVSGKTMSERFDEHVTIPTQSLDRSDGVVPRDEQVGAEVVDPVQPTGTTDSTVIGGTDPAGVIDSTTTPSTVAPSGNNTSTGSTVAPVQQTVTLTAPKGRDQIKKELESAIINNDQSSFNRLMAEIKKQIVEIKDQKTEIMSLLEEILTANPSYTKKLNVLLTQQGNRT